jgi:hypothetical protein
MMSKKKLERRMGTGTRSKNKKRDCREGQEKRLERWTGKRDWIEGQENGL